MARAECALLLGRSEDALGPGTGSPTTAGSAQQRHPAATRGGAGAAVLPRRSGRAGRRRAVAALTRVAREAGALASRCRSERRADLARQAELIAWEASLRARPVVTRGRPPAERPLPVRRQDPLATRLLTRRCAPWRRRPATPPGGRGGTPGLGRAGRLPALVRLARPTDGQRRPRRGAGAAGPRGGARERLAGRRAGLRRADPCGLHPAAAGAAAERPGTAEMLATLRRVEEEVRGLEGDPAARPGGASGCAWAADLQRGDPGAGLGARGRGRRRRRGAAGRRARAAPRRPTARVRDARPRPRAVGRGGGRRPADAAAATWRPSPRSVLVARVRADLDALADAAPARAAPDRRPSQPRPGARPAGRAAAAPRSGGPPRCSPAAAT